MPDRGAFGIPLRPRQPPCQLRVREQRRRRVAAWMHIAAPSSMGRGFIRSSLRDCLRDRAVFPLLRERFVCEKTAHASFSGSESRVICRLQTRMGGQLRRSSPVVMSGGPLRPRLRSSDPRLGRNCRIRPSLARPPNTLASPGSFRLILGGFGRIRARRNCMLISTSRARWHNPSQNSTRFGPN